VTSFHRAKSEDVRLFKGEVSEQIPNSELFLFVIVVYTTITFTFAA